MIFHWTVDTAQPVNYVTQGISSSAFHDNIKTFLYIIFTAELHINIASCGYMCLNKNIADGSGFEWQMMKVTG